MQIRCQNCHRPFALSKEFVREALDQLEADGNTRVNVTCPHCRRQNPVSKTELQHHLHIETHKPA